MRKVLFICSLLIATVTSAQSLSYYLPDSVRYDPSIPKPKDVIHHEVGEWHITHDRLVNYMQAIAKAAPGRVKLETMGYTYEGRPQVLLIFTSSKNHQNLEAIRQQHVQLTDPARSPSLDVANMPVVLYIGHSIHGNEPSGANASLLSAYYLAAAQGPQIDDLLEHAVILFDPSFNPDGLQRFSTWVNQHKSKNPVTDPNSREFNETWPSGRFNHYLFDLNRDWLPAQHVESQNRLAWFHKWKPNILTDHHEQGSNATFFFQPGVPSRVNPLTPTENQEMTGRIAKFHAAFLDRIGSLYFTKENYDDFYYGKGSTYPDVNGAVGILFEQASSRGHAQQTANGVLRFPFTIRNQFTTTLSTLEAARHLRRDLLDMQRNFYRSASAAANAYPVKGYVIGDALDRNRTDIFVNMLLRHQIQVHRLGEDMKAGDASFRKGEAYVVPANQPQHRLIRAIFEKTLTYKDSLFYDITAWTMPLAFGLPYAELPVAQFRPGLMGEAVREITRPVGQVAGGRSNYAYLMRWTDLNAPGALYEIVNAGLMARVATKPFTVDGRPDYPAGTILVPVGIQSMDAERIFNTLGPIASKYGVTIEAVNGGSAQSGMDLGSSRFAPVSKPTVGLVAGAGVAPWEAGEIWHLLDQRFNMPVSLLEPAVINRSDLSRYTTLILVATAGGNYLPELNKDKIRNWVQGGGTLIVFDEAAAWAAQNGISGLVMRKTKPAVDSGGVLAYIDREQLEGAQELSGSIFRAEVDLTHPLAFGYNRPYISTFKPRNTFFEKSKNPFATPFYYRAAPLESGWVSRENLNAVKNAGAVVVSTQGSGRVISIDHNPNFRAFWLGGTKLMMNSIFFSKVIDPASGRTE